MKAQTPAVIHVTTTRTDTMNGDQEFERLFKIERPVNHEDIETTQPLALWEYNNGGYVRLEWLSTIDDIDEAIETVREILPDYILNETIEDLSVTRRE